MADVIAPVAVRWDVQAARLWGALSRAPGVLGVVSGPVERCLSGARRVGQGGVLRTEGRGDSAGAGPGSGEGRGGGRGRSPWGAGQSAVIHRNAVKAFTWDSRIPVRHSQKLLLLEEGGASS